jgi:putative hydrolase of the HAD superfamily
MVAIFFDVDGTLVHFPDGYGPIITEAFESTVGHVDPDWLHHYNDRFFEYFGAFADDPYGEAFADVCDTHGIDVDPDSLADALLTAEFRAAEPTPGATDVIPALAEDHTLGLLTNGIPEVQFEKVERAGLREHFDACVASHQPAVEAIKPDSGIFETARESVAEESCVMVGDDPDADIEGARDCGFEAVQVDPDDGLTALDQRLESVFADESAVTRPDR